MSVTSRWQRDLPTIRIAQSKGLTWTILIYRLSQKKAGLLTPLATLEGVRHWLLKILFKFWRHPSDDSKSLKQRTFLMTKTANQSLQRHVMLWKLLFRNAYKELPDF